MYNKRGRRLKRKSFIIQIKGVGAVPTFRSRVVIKDVDKAATSNSQFIGSRLPVITTQQCGGGVKRNSLYVQYKDGGAEPPLRSISESSSVGRA